MFTENGVIRIVVTLTKMVIEKDASNMTETQNHLIAPMTVGVMAEILWAHIQMSGSVIRNPERLNLYRR